MENSLRSGWAAAWRPLDVRDSGEFLHGRAKAWWGRGRYAAFARARRHAERSRPGNRRILDRISRGIGAPIDARRDGPGGTRGIDWSIANGREARPDRGK